MKFRINTTRLANKVIKAVAVVFTFEKQQENVGGKNLRFLQRLPRVPSCRQQHGVQVHRSSQDATLNELFPGKGHD